VSEASAIPASESPDRYRDGVEPTAPAAPVDLDVTEVERELCRLPEVNAARIVVDEVGRPTEVHILATSGKHAKQVARDIQSVAMASFGLELDRRIISVVQLDGGQGDESVIGTPMRGGRVIVGSITSEQRGVRQVIRVALEREDDKSEGVVVASSTRRAGDARSAPRAGSGGGLRRRRDGDGAAGGTARRRGRLCRVRRAAE